MRIEHDFRRFNFGFADSITEYKQSPELLQDGYYDLGGIEERVINSHEFLLLGYKGSGKSAVGARLRLLAENSPGRFSVPPPLLVDELPLSQLKGVVPDSMGAEIKHRNAWILHLLVQVSNALAQDGQGNSESRKRLSSVADKLKKHGVTPQRPSTMRWFRTNKVTATVGVAGIANLAAELERQTDASTLMDWLDYLKRETSHFRSTRRHFLFIDGLDDLSLIREGRSEQLGGLVRAVTDLNREYKENDTPVKIILCCRTDLYEKVSLPRRGKIRRDYGLELNWYQDPRDYRTTHLARLANMRAQLVDKGCRDIFGEFFPPKLFNEVTAKALLLQTRHTPRDMLQLLKIVQKYAEASGVIPDDKVKAGIREYSKVYLMDEMRDALHAYFDNANISRIETLLGILHRRTFTFQDARDVVDADPRFGGDFDLHKALDYLFETSFIGNVTPQGYFFFKYRNPEASLSYDDDMQLHPGLWKALNVA
jgi:hypothetical protein